MSTYKRILFKLRRELIWLASKIISRKIFYKSYGLKDFSATENISNLNKNMTVQMFWAYGKLSKPEIISINSFLKNGFQLNLWTYNLDIKVPYGVHVKDAKEIIAEELVFTYKNGSYAGIADLFRYAVLSKNGGIWADTDVVCLIDIASFSKIELDGFFVTERTKDFDKLTVNNNFIYHPNPNPGDIIDLAYQFALHIDKAKLDWGDIGPKLLRVLAEFYPNLRPALMEPSFCNPIDYWDCPSKLLKNTKLPKDAAFIHLYNEMWRSRGIDKNDVYPKNSLMSQLEEKYYIKDKDSL